MEGVTEQVVVVDSLSLSLYPSKRIKKRSLVLSTRTRAFRCCRLRPVEPTNKIKEPFPTNSISLFSFAHSLSLLFLVRALVNDLLAGRNSEPPVVECHVATLLLDYIIIQNFVLLLLLTRRGEFLSLDAVVERTRVGRRSFG